MPAIRPTRITLLLLNHGRIYIYIFHVDRIVVDVPACAFHKEWRKHRLVSVLLHYDPSGPCRNIDNNWKIPLFLPNSIISLYTKAQILYGSAGTFFRRNVERIRRSIKHTRSSLCEQYETPLDRKVLHNEVALKWGLSQVPNSNRLRML